MNNFDISYSLIYAVREGNLGKAKLLINSFGLFYSQAWLGGYVLLCDATKKNYTAIIKLLLANGSKVNSKNSKKKQSNTPLHFAVINGDIEIVKMLLDRNANIDAKNKYGRTPLHNAIKIRNITQKRKIIKLLLNRGANVDAQDNDGKTILQFAVEKRHSVISKLILKYCPDINNKSNKSSFNAAVYGYGKECSKIVENLLHYGFTVNPEDINNFKLLDAAIKKGYLKIVEELLNYGIDVNMIFCSNGHKLLHLATLYKQKEVAKLLISYKADVNAKDKTRKTPLFYAIENADLKFIKLLLTNGANVKDPKLLNIAVKKECRKIVEVLLQHGADVNASDAYGRTALHLTAWSENGRVFLNKNSDDVKAEIAKLLLSRGANVNAQTKNNRTTLYAAIKNGYVKVVEALLEHNADVNSVIESDITPLHLSAQKGSKEISKMLLNKGANVNAKQKDGKTALHIATQKNHKKVVKVLLQCGATVNSKVKRGLTPLHIAARRGYLNVVKILIKFGAGVDSRSGYGRTALHFAVGELRTRIVRTLLEHGSDINIINKTNDTPLDVARDNLSFFDNRREVHYDSDDSDYYRWIDREIWAREIAEYLKLHIVKMKTANLYVSEQNLLRSNMYEFSDFGNDPEEYLLGFDNKIRDLTKECEKEVAIMNSEKINNTIISFYDILTKSTNSLAIYMRNKNIVQVLKSDDYKTKFPIYASMIENNFRKGMKRKELLEQGNKTFHFLFNYFPELLYHCIEKIFSYLSDEDLRIFINTSVHTPNTDINNVASTSNISKVLYI